VSEHDGHAHSLLSTDGDVEIYECLDCQDTGRDCQFAIEPDGTHVPVAELKLGVHQAACLADAGPDDCICTGAYDYDPDERAPMTGDPYWMRASEEVYRYG
jgi:hypothetical protein